MKKPLPSLQEGTFFTFDNQLGDLFIKTPTGLMRVPNKTYGHTYTWDNSMYEKNTNYVILTADEVKDRLVQIGETHCKTCGHKL